VLAGIAALVYFSGALDADSQLKRDSPAFESNVRSGLLGAVGVFLGEPCSGTPEKRGPPGGGGVTGFRLRHISFPSTC